MKCRQVISSDVITRQIFHNRNSSKHKHMVHLHHLISFQCHDLSHTPSSFFFIESLEFCRIPTPCATYSIFYYHQCRFYSTNNMKTSSVLTIPFQTKISQDRDTGFAVPPLHQQLRTSQKTNDKGTKKEIIIQFLSVLFLYESNQSCLLPDCLVLILEANKFQAPFFIGLFEKESSKG